MKKIALLVPVAALMLTAACKKDKDSTPAPATITITSPTEGETIDHGDSVNIRATITYPTDLHGYEAWVLNTDNGDTLMDIDEHAHGTSIAIDTGFVNHVTVHTACQLTIRAEIDHDGHYTDKSVVFHLHPME